MEHGGMSMDSREMDGAMETMRSAFHVEIPFTVLFTEWNVDSMKAVIFSCVLLMLLSFFNECIRVVRGHINSIITDLVKQKREKSRLAEDRQQQVAVIQSVNGCHCVALNEVKIYEKKMLESVMKAQASRFNSVKRFMKSSGILLHLISCFLYGLEMLFSLGLMLSVMSFHTGVLASVIIGAMLGRVVLHWPGRLPFAQEEEPVCH